MMRPSSLLPAILSLLASGGPLAASAFAAVLPAMAPDGHSRSVHPGELMAATEELRRVVSRGISAPFQLEVAEFENPAGPVRAGREEISLPTNSLRFHMERSRASTILAPDLLLVWMDLASLPPKPAPRLPDSAESCLRRAATLIAEKKRSAAIPFLLRAHSLKPRDFPLALKIGALLQAPETGAEAQAFAQRLVERFPTRAEASQLLGSILQQEGRSEDALAAFRKARQLNPKSAAIWFAEGTTNLALQRWDEAAIKLVQAVRLDPKNERHWRGLTDGYRTSRDFLSGEAKLKQLTEEFPTSAPAWYSLGCLQVAGGLRQIGFKSWQKAIELRPKYADAWSQIGVVQLQDDDRKGALESIQRALKAQPNHAEAANNRGWLRLSEGKLDPAIADFQTAIKTDPTYARAMVNLIRALVKKGNLDGANEVCKRLTALDANAGATMRKEIDR